MAFSAPQNRPVPLAELPAIKQRLLSVRASLLQTCRDLDSQISSLDQAFASFTAETPAQALPPSLFEHAPAPDAPPSPAAGEVAQPARPSLVLKATTPSTLDPQLEQATLEELNAALSKAFAHIAGQAPW